jgi:hypothetical protein
VGSGELNGGRITDRGTQSFTQIHVPSVGNNLRPTCLTLLQWCLQRDVLQWQRRLNLAKVMSSRRFERSDGDGKKCLGLILELPPNLLYAKVESRDCSPSRLQIDEG